MGIDRGEIPDLTRAPQKQKKTLEAHLAQLEGRPVTSPTSGGYINLFFIYAIYVL